MASACVLSCALLLSATSGAPPKDPGVSRLLVKHVSDTVATTYPGPVIVASPPTDAAQPARAHAHGWRERLEHAGLTLGVSSIWDSSRLDTGTSSGGVMRALTDVSLTIDLDAIAGLGGATAFVQYLWRHGPNGSERLGDVQGFSNIDADAFSGVSEVWIEQRFASDRFRLKAGRVDANTEFAMVATASDFLNSSMGFSPTIAAMPTYPEPALSVNAFATLPANVSVGIGLYGESDGPQWRRPFAIGEVGTRWTLRLGGQARVGAWRKRSGETGDVARGLYGVVEQTLWASKRRTLDAFAQVGHSSSATCATDRHVGGGVIVRGLPRAEDAIGFGVTRVRSGLLADEPGGVELAFGPFVRLQVTPWLALTPDVQFVRHPGGRREHGTRAVATLRMTAGF